MLVKEDISKHAVNFQTYVEVYLQKVYISEKLSYKFKYISVYDHLFTLSVQNSLTLRHKL